MLENIELASRLSRAINYACDHSEQLVTITLDDATDLFSRFKRRDVLCEQRHDKCKWLLKGVCPTCTSNVYAAVRDPEDARQYCKHCGQAIKFNLVGKDMED